MGDFVYCCQYWISTSLPIISGTPFAYFLNATGVAPILLALWHFRTYDVRQQIEKAEQQIQQATLESGMNKLIGEHSLSIDVGTQLLLKLSSETNRFNDQIQLAFIKRLQYWPSKAPKSWTDVDHPYDRDYEEERRQIFLGDSRISYAQYIWEWLTDHSTKDPIKLQGMSFYYSELGNKESFTLEEIRIAIEEHKKPDVSPRSDNT